jgi:hypothetical protein
VNGDADELLCNCRYEWEKDEQGKPVRENRVPNSSCRYHKPKVREDEMNRAGRREAPLNAVLF